MDDEGPGSRLAVSKRLDGMSTHCPGQLLLLDGEELPGRVEALHGAPDGVLELLLLHLVRPLGDAGWLLVPKTLISHTPAQTEAYVTEECSGGQHFTPPAP
jgi:hypothetical protein